ncbi:MAG TPA: dipeptidase [Chitinophagales bacterium]|nr:dipeptidase [Chitinophagales bacterium]
MQEVKNYIAQNKQRFLDELFEVLRIPSVSADKRFAKDVIKAGEWVKARLLQAGAENVELFPTKGYPVVYGEKIINPALPTVLVYGHYDVQPPDPLELWHSPPFEPVLKDSKIYARGACDDKGQMYMHVKAFELMMKLNMLPCNVKFMIEGEEEVGSENLGDFVRANKKRLKADVILISDTSMVANDVPSITIGLRGLSYHEVEVTGPNRDLHSGVYGGAVANPLNILAEMIASLKDKNNRIAIPGFYDDVAELTVEERRQLAQIPFDEAEYKKHLDVAALHGETGYTPLEHVTIRPTLDVNGMWGGYTGEGAKTVLPSKAFAKISMRLVPNQNHEKITELFVKHFISLAPPSVKVKVLPHHGGNPVLMSTASVAYKAAEKAYEMSFGKKPLPARTGGSIPIVALFEEVLGLKSILMGFGLDSDAIHSPNEHFGVFNFLMGIETIAYFYQNYAKGEV